MKKKIDSSSSKKNTTAPAKKSTATSLSSLPKWQARVEIAKDALKLLKKNYFRPRKQVYISTKLPKGQNLARDFVSANSIAENRYRCEVCAVGACFLAMTSRQRSGASFVLAQAKDGRQQAMAWREDIQPELLHYFRPLQLGLIETAFEGEICLAFETNLALGRNKKSVEKARAYRTNYPDLRDRMSAILKNIIKNEGKFVP